MLLGWLEVWKMNDIFFTLSFMKNRLCNKLTNHLDFIVHMFASKKFTLKNVLYNDAIRAWKKAKKQCGYNAWRFLFSFCNMFNDYFLFHVFVIVGDRC